MSRYLRQVIRHRGWVIALSLLVTLGAPAERGWNTNSAGPKSSTVYDARGGTTRYSIS